MVEVRVCASTPGTGTPTGYEGRRGTCSVVPMRIRRTFITVGSLPTISLMELEEEKQQKKNTPEKRFWLTASQDRPDNTAV